MATTFSTSAPVTPRMTAVGFSWLSVIGIVTKLINLLSTGGPDVMAFVADVLKMVADITARDLSAIIADLGSLTADVNKIISDLRAEFGIPA